MYVYSLPMVFLSIRWEGSPTVQTVYGIKDKIILWASAFICNTGLLNQKKKNQREHKKRCLTSQGQTLKRDNVKSTEDPKPEKKVKHLSLLEKSLVSAGKGYEVRAVMWTGTPEWTPEHISACYWAQGKRLLKTCFVSTETLQEYWEKGTRFREYGAGKEKRIKNKTRAI